MSYQRLGVVCAFLFLLQGCSSGQGGPGGAAGAALIQQQGEVGSAPQRVEKYTYEIVNTYSHDAGAFTQGLVYSNGMLYESTGLNGQSSVRRVELETGRVLGRYDILPQFFGEGLTLLSGRLYQLTWQNQIGFIYDASSLQPAGSFGYLGEGWGLTTDGQSLIMSNGTNLLTFLDPRTFEVGRVVGVFDDSRPVANLNELEYIKGEIYANVWQTDRIARIDPATGRLKAWVYLNGLLSDQDRTSRVDVLNGIAYDEANDRIFVTGKLWPKLFEIRLKQRRTNLSR